MGWWTAMLLATALAAWLLLHPPTDRCQSMTRPGLVLDRTTGESYYINEEWLSGPGHINRSWLERLLVDEDFRSLLPEGNATVLQALYAKHAPKFVALIPDRRFERIRPHGRQALER
jgi:hypothetical protein